MDSEWHGTLDGFAGGGMATPLLTTTNGTTTGGGAVETRDGVFGNYVFTSVANRRYEVHLNGLQQAGSAGNDQYLVNIRNGGSSTPTATSALIAQQRIFIPVANAQIACPMAMSWSPGAGVNTLSLFVQRVA